MHVRLDSTSYSGDVAYEVQTDVYEGPFDLLLHLILREEVDLYEVSLSTIVDAYLAELERMEELDLEVATEFLLIAATLVELKARRLLPVDDNLDLDEELALWEERDLLLARLVECKTFKDASQVLAVLVADDVDRCYPRPRGLEDRFVDLTPDILEGVDARRSAPRLHPGGIATSGSHRRHRSTSPPSVRQRDRCRRRSCADELRFRRRATFRDARRALRRATRAASSGSSRSSSSSSRASSSSTRSRTFGEIEVVWSSGHEDERSFELAAVDAYDG
ncbi:MAG: segregation/condensation protein A [Acidimicrobiia bacterium]|nr:segregation/condensation protein A [Acidimicrobiia bacterium]